MNLDKKVATRQSYGEKLAELGKTNKDIVVFDADLANATKTSIFAKEFPNRFFDMGIAEQDMIETAAVVEAVMIVEEVLQEDLLEEDLDNN